MIKAKLSWQRSCKEILAKIISEDAKVGRQGNGWTINLFQNKSCRRTINLGMSHAELTKGPCRPHLGLTNSQAGVSGKPQPANSTPTFLAL